MLGKNHLWRLIEWINLENRGEIWTSDVLNAYSVIILIKETRISTNGKGVTRGLALASGYGELIERIQGMLYFRISDCFKLYFQYSSNEDACYGEKYISLDCEKDTSWFDMVFSTKKNEWIEYFRTQYGSKLVACFFSNIKRKDDYCPIPYILKDYLYGSNGMAAGNSYEEALVQGISEIIL